MGRKYFRGYDFPYEGFVQLAIEKHFTSLGYHINTSSDADLICTHPLTYERWVIEAKGMTANVGIDFRTALGQLMQRMDNPSAKYAISVPYMPQYIKQCQIVPHWVRKKLNIHWLLVKEDGAVICIGPGEEFLTSE